MRTTVRKVNYGDYSSDNYGSHTQRIHIGNLTLWFSYDTVVAFENGVALYCSENVWSTTTGKHLNWIQPDKKRRIPSEQFEIELRALLRQHNLTFD